MSYILRISASACMLVLLVAFGVAPSSPDSNPSHANLTPVHPADASLMAATAADASHVTTNPADVKYTTVTTMKIAGAAGRAVNFLARLGGGSTDMAETVYVKGNKMLRESDDVSTLIDLDAGSMTTIDHDKKTYSVMTFDEMRDQMERMAESMTGAAQENTETPADATEAPEVSDTEFSFEFNVDRTGLRSDVNGNPAERFLTTLIVEASGTVTEEGKEEQYEGTMVVASDLWLSTDLQGYGEVEDFHRRFGERLGEAMMGAAETANLAEAMQQAFAGDPRIQEGMEKAQEEVQKMDGVEVKNTTHFVLVAPGERFNGDLVFGQKDDGEAKAEEEKPKGGLFARAARIARQAAADQPSDAEPKEAATQQVLLTLTTEMQEYSTSSVPASVFAIPSGYKQVELGR